MAPYTNKAPRRSSRLQNLPAVNYADTRSYHRAAVAKNAPIKKAPAKKAPIKKTPAKKAPLKKSTTKKVKQESSSSSSSCFPASQESESNLTPAAPAKKAAGKKNPPKTIKQESSKYDSDEFLDDEDSDSVKKVPAKKFKFKRVKKRDPAPPVLWIGMDAQCGITARLNLGTTLTHSFDGLTFATGDPELEALVETFRSWMEKVREICFRMSEDPDGDHPTLASLYFSLETDPQGPRAALEAALAERGEVESAQVDMAFFVSRECLRHMYLSWRDMVIEVELQNVGEVEGVYQNFEDRTGLYLVTDDEEE